MPRTRNQRKRSNKSNNIFTKIKNIEINKEIKLSVITILLFLVFVTLLVIVFDRIFVRSKFSADLVNISNNNSDEIFSLDKIFLFSSANAIHNDENKNFWNLNVYQYTDIAVYISNNSDYLITNKNAVKNLYIDNIHFSNTSKGVKSLYYKDINAFGNSILNDSNLINGRLDFNVVNVKSDLDYSTPQIYNTLDNPITLEFVNKSFKDSTIIPNNNQLLVFDGSLISKSNTPLSDLAETLSFTIHIINNFDEEFLCTVQIQIPLEDESTSQNITNGYVKKTISNLSEYKFYKKTTNK